MHLLLPQAGGGWEGVLWSRFYTFLFKNKHIISNDEKTGIQALERTNPYLPMIQGQIERREFEYTRHGMQALIASFNVATGTVFGTVDDTRTEDDYVVYCQNLWDTDPNGTWVMITDQLNIHQF